MERTERDIKAIWQDILESSSNFLPQGTSSMWLSTCVPISIENGVLLIDVPNPFAKQNMEKKILKPLEDFIRKRGYAETVQIQLDESLQEQERAKAVVETQTIQKTNGTFPFYLSSLRR